MFVKITHTGTACQTKFESWAVTMQCWGTAFLLLSFSTAKLLYSIKIIEVGLAPCKWSYTMRIGFVSCFRNDLHNLSDLKTGQRSIQLILRILQHLTYMLHPTGIGKCSPRRPWGHKHLPGRHDGQVSLWLELCVIGFWLHFCQNKGCKYCTASDYSNHRECTKPGSLCSKLCEIYWLELQHVILSMLHITLSSVTLYCITWLWITSELSIKSLVSFPAPWYWQVARLFLSKHDKKL